MNIFFTSPFVEREKYKAFIDRIIAAVSSTGATIITPSSGRAYQDAFSEENFKKYGDKNRIHYEFIRQGIANADAIIIESSEEDFRVGHEATLALIYKKPVLCLSQKQDFGKLIYHEGFQGQQYTSENLEQIVLDFIQKISDRILKQRNNPLSNFSNTHHSHNTTGKTIITLGAITIDMFTKVPFIPKVDDVVVSEGLKLLPGGKATNASIGMARLGQKIYLIGKTGNDSFGQTAREVLQQENISTKFLDSDAFVPTGTVMVNVNEEGKNTIIVNEDAYVRINKPTILELLGDIDKGNIHADCFYTTLEIPREIVYFAIEEFAKRNILIFVDAAPQIFSMEKKYYAFIDILSANELEATAMTGIKVHDRKTAEKAALALREEGANTIIITLGKTGSVILQKDTDIPIYFPGKKVKTIDETAAGDAFRAAFVTEYLQSNDIQKAMEFGNLVGAYATTRLGSYEALPTREELEFVEFID